MTQKALFGPDTPEWHLAAYLKWTPKVSTEVREKCSCRMWSCPDNDACSECYGLGYVTRTVDLPPHPPIPEGLTEHMRKAWNEFFNKGNENDVD
jgi:hypothetical protein